jgi:hypothetical protein
MKRFTKPMLPLLALLLLQISLVHGFQHDASHFDSAPTQTTHSETDCLLGDTSPALAGFFGSPDTVSITTVMSFI